MHGKGGRNQEFVLAVLHQLGAAGMPGVAVLSGGTDGEDGPTDAAGAVADETNLGRDPADTGSNVASSPGPARRLPALRRGRRTDPHRADAHERHGRARARRALDDESDRGTFFITLGRPTCKSCDAAS